jgi:hypothetical protein
VRRFPTQNTSRFVTAKSLEIRRSLAREVEQERWTTLDDLFAMTIDSFAQQIRINCFAMDTNSIHVSASTVASGQPHEVGISPVPDY